MAEDLIMSEESTDSDTALGCSQPAPMSRISTASDIRDSQVCHAEAEVVYRSTDEARTSRVAERCPKAQGNRAESATCSDFAQSRRRWSKLDRRAHRRGLRMSDKNR